MHNPNQNNDINVDFTSNTKVMLLQLRQWKFCSIHIQTLQEIGQFHTFHPSQILYISLTPKNLYLDCWAISYFSSIPTWIRYDNKRFRGVCSSKWGMIETGCYRREDRWFRSCKCFEEIKEREKARRLGVESSTWSVFEAD